MIDMDNFPKGLEPEDFFNLIGCDYGYFVWKENWLGKTEGCETSGEYYFFVNSIGGVEPFKDGGVSVGGDCYGNSEKKLIIAVSRGTHTPIILRTSRCKVEDGFKHDNSFNELNIKKALKKREELKKKIEECQSINHCDITMSQMDSCIGATKKFQDMNSIIDGDWAFSTCKTNDMNECVKIIPQTKNGFHPNSHFVNDSKGKKISLKRVYEDPSILDEMLEYFSPENILNAFKLLKDDGMIEDYPDFIKGKFKYIFDYMEEAKKRYVERKKLEIPWEL